MHAEGAADRIPATDTRPGRLDTGHRITVRALVAEPLLGGRVLGGDAGLDNPVSWCLPLSEVGGKAHATRGRDLSTVAVHLDADELSTYDRARALIADLRRRGAAALLVWPGGHADVDLRAAGRAAEEMAVPLVTVAPEADFRSAGYLVATKVLAQSKHVLEYSVRVHRALGEVFAHGSGLQALTRTMSQLAQTPVMVVGTEDEVLAYGDVTGSDVTVDHRDRFPELGTQVLVDPHDEGATSSCRLVTFELSGGTMHAMAAPITVASETYGTVALLEPVWPADEHDLAQHAVIAEQGSTLVGSELLRQRSVHAAEERARGDFVDTLLHGRFTDQHEIAARSQYYDFDPQGRFAVFVVTATAPARGRRPRVSSTGTVAGSLAKSLESTLTDDRLTLTAVIGSMLVIIREFPASGRRDSDALAERSARQEFAEKVRRTALASLKDDVQVTHGRAGVGAVGVAQSYREARTAAALARRTSAPQVCGYDDLRVFAAVQEVASSVSGRAFAAEVLEPIRRADGQTGNLEEIVLAYINESGNLNAAARKLHLHRNTMLYKLDRASRAMQMDVRTAETQFMIWLAHYIDSMAQVQALLDAELEPPS